MHTDPNWIVEAKKHIGLREDTSKTSHSPKLVAMLERIGDFCEASWPWWKDDETPWCGLFVGYCLGVSGRYVVKEWYRARAWESPLLTKLDRPAYGSIVTFTRTGGGHVGFVVGVDHKGNILVLGGNQGNAVSIVPFAQERVTGYYWPSFWRDGAAVKSIPLDTRYGMQPVGSAGEVSTNES